AAIVFAVVALGASVLGVVAYRSQQEAQRQRERAEQSLTAATATANGLIVDLAQRFRHASGVPTALVKDILDRARALQEQLTRAGATPNLRYSEASALIEITTTLLDQGDTKGALEAAERSRQIMQELVAAQPNNVEWQDGLSTSYYKLGDVLVEHG